MPSSSRAKPTALEAFTINMADARHLVGIAEALTNTRRYRMRKELRDRIGTALKIPARERENLDCLQSPQLFVTFLPGSGISRSDFDDARPLLRQAVVAACAAGETYIADRTMELVGPLMTAKAATDRLRKIPLTVDTWLHIEARYERRKVGLRGHVVEPWVRREASTDPTKVGQLLSLLGVKDWTVKLDKERGVARGDTEAFLKRITDRRNKIAHEGDRSGRGRAALTASEVSADLVALESVINAIHSVTARMD
jgi:hypothetical protein